MSSRPSSPEERPPMLGGDDGSASRADWAALGAEWTRLAADLDARAAAWLTTAGTWKRGPDPHVRRAADRVEWAAQRTRDMTTWLRQAAKDLLDLT